MRHSSKCTRAVTWLTAIAALLCTAAMGSCTAASDEGEGNDECTWPDTLRVATLYSPTSYFIYRDEPMGYDYNLVQRLAQDKGFELELVVASSMKDMIALLDSGKVALAAYEIPVTAEYASNIEPCGPQTITTQVLVQPKRSKDFINDETELVGRDIYVEGGTKYQYRLENLNHELGGGINIHIIDRDTLITEDLIDMVSQGRIPLTVVDSDIARINRTYYSDIDASLPLSFPQKASWGVSKDHAWLADSINLWFSGENSKKENMHLLKRYFELSKTDGSYELKLNFDKGMFSKYDDLFRKYAEEANIDWRILATQGYLESQFDTTRVSWAGARGIMQIMPGTARAYGLQDHLIAQPEANIATAAKILAGLDRSLAGRVPDKDERIKFVIAAYNSGIAHIYDAIELAKKTGKDPTKWDDNVDQALLLKSNSEYYNDPVCRAGYFRGRETVAYVRKVFELYGTACEKVPFERKQTKKHNKSKKR